MSDASHPRGRASRERTAERIRHLLETEGEAVYANASVLNHGRAETVETFDEYETLRKDARSIKEAAIDRLPELIAQVRESVEANGGTVYVADDAADANRYVRDVVAERNGESVVKSKSMTTEEIDLNEALEEDGVDVHETDLGEWVLQLADDTPSHIVAPAMHLTREEIADLFERRFDPDEPFETAEELTRFARDWLGARIREADVGVTGANFVLAESGSIAIVTNEGNARKCAVTPDTHVAIAGVEKLLPSIRELEPFVDLIAKAATGQSIAQYVTMLSPPTDSPTLDFDRPGEPIGDGTDVGTNAEVEIDGGANVDAESNDREFHLVLLDNGRTELREDDQLRETLYCIRCGACSNSCANFQQVGGHAFGGETYSGGIGTGWEAGIHGQESAAEFNDLCTGCTRCVNACPVKIDIPWINTAVRDRINRNGDSEAYDFLVDGLSPDVEDGGLDFGKRFFGNIGTVARMGSATAPVSNWLADADPVRSLLERTLGIDRRRDLPSFERETLVDWFEARGGPDASQRRAEANRERARTAGPDREAVLYPDVYTNYVDTDRGKAAVRVLEALGVPVRVPDLPESGRAPLSQGMVATADRQASRLFGAVAEELDAGRDLVVVEPSDLAAFHREYERFLPDRSVERLREGSYEICEYVYGLLENGADPRTLRTGEGPIAYHSHCQQRTLGLEAETVAVLERCGYEPRTSTVECCGMAGSFGYKSDYYELSVAVGDHLAEQFETAETVVASGTSCADQLEDLLDRPASHPIELLDPRR